MTSKHSSRQGLARIGGFILLEAMLAVAIFALGVLTLGRCVTNCIAAERFKTEDVLARRALENRIAEIESGRPTLVGTSEEKLLPPFERMTLQQRCTPLTKKNEKGEELASLVSVRLEVTWQSGGNKQSRQLAFYVHPRRL